MNEEEKKAVDKAIYELEDSYELHQREWAKKCLNTIKHGFTKLQKENEKYKRLAEINLKNAEEYKDNMCEHRCLLKSENEELKEDLKYVLNQTLGSFEKNWCIDWNFTEIREKYNLESE